MKLLYKIFFDLIAGIVGNLIAGWIQNDLWGNVFTKQRLIGTVIALVVMGIILFLLENRKTINFGGNVMEINSSVLRELISASFDDTGFTNFCYDNYRAVYNKFSAGQNREIKNQLLVEYVEINNDVTKLLELIKKNNPQQYNRLIHSTK